MSPHPIRKGVYVEVSHDLRAPLEFAYRWCTNYRSDDLTLPNKRWVLERAQDHVLFEDFNENNPDGFEWRRLFAELHPPDRWRVECRGNRLEGSIWYSLAPGRPGRTRLTIRGVARYLEPGTRKSIPPSRGMSSKLGGYLRQNWENFGPELERDYRRSIRKYRSASPNRVRRTPILRVTRSGLRSGA